MEGEASTSLTAGKRSGEASSSHCAIAREECTIMGSWDHPTSNYYPDSDAEINEVNFDSGVSSSRYNDDEFHSQNPSPREVWENYDIEDFFPYNPEHALDSRDSSPRSSEGKHEFTNFALGESEGRFDGREEECAGKEPSPLGSKGKCATCKGPRPQSSGTKYKLHKAPSLRNYKDKNRDKTQENEPPPPPLLAVHLELVRRDANDHFTKNDNAGALARYIACITRGESALLDPTTSPTCLVLVKRILKLCYSNRAQLQLNCKMWDEVLDDTEKALKLDRNHVKSLFRRGKALQGLQQFKQACQAFGAALDRNPNSMQVAAALHESMKSHHQSVYGKYDLFQFLLYSGPPPECSDYVGPVVIKDSPNAGRGLFVTKRVEAGSLLLVSNALAIGTAPYSATQGELSVKVAGMIMKLMKASKRWAHQVYYLTGGKSEHPSDELGIPDMKMFIPGSDWSPDPNQDVSLSFVDIARRVQYNTFDASRALFDGQKVESDGRPSSVISSGVWVLPSFLNHSCIPNTGIMFIGKALFLRAAKDLEPGEELTTSYTACSNPNRRKSIRKWSFDCGCERCLQDAIVEPFLADLRKELNEYCVHFSSKKSTKSERLKALFNTVNMLERVESALKSLPLALDVQKKNWVRVTFMVVYTNRMQVANAGGDLNQKIQALQKLAEIEESINGAVHYGSMRVSSQLLSYVQRKFGKDIKEFRQAKKQVMKVLKTALGDMGEQFFLELIKVRYSKKQSGKISFIDYTS